MSSDVSSAFHEFKRNDILGSLPLEVIGALRPHLARVTIVLSQVIHELGTPIDDIFFIEQGLVSLTAETDDDGQVEVGMTGHDGVVGASALLVPGAVACHRAFVQVPGSAWRLRTTVFQEMTDRFPAFRILCLRYQQFLMVQASQASACNARHNLPQRLARWVLMTRDRIGSDELPMTQDFMAAMLGVRRAGVSAVAGELQTNGLIRQSRGRVFVLDDSGLEAAACSCYRRVADWEQIIMGAPPSTG